MNAFNLSKSTTDGPAVRPYRPADARGATGRLAGQAALLFCLLVAVVTPGQGAAQSDGSDHEKSRKHLLDEVVQSWQRPGAAPTPAPAQVDSPVSPPLMEKLESIVVPAVNFTNLELNRVVAALSSLAEEFDAADRQPHGHHNAPEPVVEARARFRDRCRRLPI